ncbi:MAG: MFS transporter [Actinomycetes bacterium]
MTPPEPSQEESRRRRLHLDLRPLRSSADFRRLYIGGGISFIGTMVTYVAIPFQVKELTDSFAAVGLVGLLQLVPMVVGGLWGGALADAHDKRRIVLLCSSVATGLAAVLMVNAFLAQPQVWVVYLVAMGFSLFDSLARPSAEALVPRLVAHDQLPAAAALTSFRMTFGSILGPTLGGVVLATWGSPWAYAIDAASYLVALSFYFRLSRVPPAEVGSRPGLRQISQGVAYAWSRKDLLGTYAIDFAAMVFAFPYAMFPFVAEELGAPWSLGWLYAAGSIGGLIAALTSGWTVRVSHHGRGVALAAVGWGVAIGLFGLTTNVWWALAMLAVAGAADMISVMFRLTMWNQSIPDELRGRLAGIELLSFTAGPQLGQVRSGLLAQATSLRFSLASGGFTSAFLTAIIAVFLPSLWRYDVRTDPNAALQRKRRAQEAARLSSGGERCEE